MRFEPGLLSKAILAATFAVVFSGCGGGGGHHDDPAPVVDDDHQQTEDPVTDDHQQTEDPVQPQGPVTHALSGTAASGAPIIGQVTIKDANGTLRAVDIEANGHYSVDVSDLTAPFLLRAAGNVGGRRVVLVSAATSADLDGTINITPFTDLIVANIAGQVASTYFDNANFSTLSADQLNAAKTTLTQRLQPILTSLGITDSFDLLRTAFNADHSGFDAVMDAVSVTVDEVSGFAQIRDLINNTQILDNLADATDATALPVPVIGLADVIGDLAQIEQVLAAITAQLAVALPAANDAAFRSLFVSEGFLDYGEDLDTFMQELSTDDGAKGIKLTGARIIERIDDSTLRIGYQVVHQGFAESGDWVMKKVAGVWKIAGDQRIVGQDISAVNARNVSGNFGWLDVGSSYQRYLETYVDYAPEDVEYMAVSGPGLSDTVVLHRSTQWQGFVILKSDETETSSTWISECGQQETLAPCVTFSEVGVNSVYTFLPLDSNGVEISGKPAFTRILPAPPLSNAQATINAANLFGSVTSITPANYTQLTNGSTITLNLGLPPAGGNVLDSVTYRYENANHSDVDPGVVHLESNTLNANGTSVDLTWEGDAPQTDPSISVWTRGDLNRRFVTLGRHRLLQ